MNWNWHGVNKDGDNQPPRRWAELDRVERRQRVYTVITAAILWLVGLLAVIGWVLVFMLAEPTNH